MRTLENNYETIVILDRDDISTTLMEIFLQHAGFDGAIVKKNLVSEAYKVLDESPAPVLFIADYFTNYLDNFEFFDAYRSKADRIIVVGEFEEELQRFKKQYAAISFYRKPHTVEEVRSWLDK